MQDISKKDHIYNKQVKEMMIKETDTKTKVNSSLQENARNQTP